MILAAGYLLWMYQRIVFGEVSDFLKGLGHHLTDMTPTEILTLGPLAALVVVFGLFPGLVLDLVQGSVDASSSRDVGAAGPDRARAADRASSLIALPILYVVGRLIWVARIDLPAVAARRPTASASDRRRGRVVSAADLNVIAPLLAAIATAIAILLVDLVAAEPARRRSVFAALAGLAVTAAVTVAVGVGRGDLGVRRSAAMYRLDALTTFLDLLFISIVAMTIVFAPDYLDAARPARRRVRDRPRVRDVRGDGDRRVGRPAAALPRPRAHGPARLPARRLPQVGQLLDRGRDQVLPPRLVQLGDLPVRARVRLGPDRLDEHRRRREHPDPASRPARRRSARASRWASRS